MTSTPSRWGGVSTGAAFLMAVSAIGPGFLTQTTLFTAQLGASLACAILISILIDIGAQLNTWRAICISQKRGHELASALIPGLGWVVAGVVIAGSFVFNIGNLFGCALGLEELLGLSQGWGATLSTALAVGLFLLPAMLKGMDWFSKILGVGMILMTLYVLALTRPPVGDAARQALWPDRLDQDSITAIVTLVGGTIGGYIMFSGAHRLLDGGVGGTQHLGQITWASIQGILITGVMRIVLFLAVLGVVAGGAALSNTRPVFDAFTAGAGRAGFVLSALIFWAAAITSVVGCSYTAISFTSLQGRRRAGAMVTFLVLSLAVVLILLWQNMEATQLLVLAGTLNGILLPIVLLVVLLATQSRRLMGDYRHPWWATALGGLAWLATVYFAYRAVADAVEKLGK